MGMATAVRLAVVLHVVVHQRLFPGWGADIDQCLIGARALWHGANPYAVIGPHGTWFRWPWPLYYPLTALFAVTPLAWMPLAVARPIFIGGSSAWLAFMVSRRSWAPLLLFLSGAFLNTVDSGTWDALLVAAAITPGMGWLLLAKPNVGAALAMMLERRRATAVAAGIGVGFVALTVAIMPGWLTDWRAALATGVHFVPPLLLPLGFLVLPVLVKWRRPEARLLVALACVPQTLYPHAALALFLVPRGRAEMTALAILSFVPLALAYYTAPTTGTMAEQTRLIGVAMVACLYLPCVIMVLRRPAVAVA
jgi:hypothetical protein